MTAIAPVLQAFFTDRLMSQLRASPHTIASYRDTMRLLLAFACQQRGKQPSQLDFTDLDAPVIGAFLTDLETARGNGVTTRNARLTAIHSLFRYASLHVPEHAGLISRVLAIPGKRHDHPTVCFLTREEISALLAAPNPATWPAAAIMRCSSSASRQACGSPSHRPRRQRRRSRHRAARDLPRQRPQGTRDPAHPRHRSRPP